MTTPAVPEFDPWALETGLPDKVNGYMINSQFGVNADYAAKVAASATEPGDVPIMFMADLVAEDGTYIGGVGYSVGGGWIAAADGQSMSHPAKNNVVNSSRYGAFQAKVLKELEVDMRARGIPTTAAIWNGIGFFWSQQKLYTVGGDPKDVLFPEKYIGYLDPTELNAKFMAKGGKPTSSSAATVTAPAVAAAPAPGVVPAAPITAAVPEPVVIPESVKALAKTLDVVAFQQAALKNQEVLANPALINLSLDTGPAGLYEMAKAA